MIYVLISALIIGLDQLTKYFVRKLPADFEYNVIGDFLRIVHVENSGAAFGMFQGNRKFLLIIPAIVIVLAVILLVKSNKSDKISLGPVEKLALVLVASGGVGNIIDRILYGHVTDMISFSIFPPVFNVADIAVTCGCGLMILSLFLNKEKDDRV